jgi:predicted DNA-binding protein with PD1-like motif
MHSSVIPEEECYPFLTYRRIRGTVEAENKSEQGGKTMDYRRFGDTLLVRIDRGEEILEQVKTVALKENIQLASVQALGALGSFTVGVYKVDEKKYYANSFEGSFEIVSLTGTIDTMNGEFYTHLHLSAGNDRGEVFGGHLNRAEVSATCEMVIRLIDGRIDRQYDDVTGLNLFKFL